MDDGAPLVADGEATVLGQPSEGAFNDPTMSPQPLAALDTLAGNPAFDPTTTEELAAAGDVIPLIGVQLLGPLASPVADRLDGRDSINEPLEEHRVVAIGATQETDERDVGSVNHNMPLRPRFPFIRWMRPGLIAPFFAGTL